MSLVDGSEGFSLYCLMLAASLSCSWWRHWSWVRWTYPNTLSTHRGLCYKAQCLYGFLRPPALSPSVYAVLQTSLILVCLSVCYGIGYLRLAALLGWGLCCLVTPQWAGSRAGSHMNLFPVHVFASYALSPSTDLAALCVKSTFLLTYLGSAIHKAIAKGDITSAAVMKHYIYEVSWLYPVQPWRETIRQWFLRSPPLVLSLIGYATIILELLVIPLALVTPTLAAASVILFHLSILILFDLDFIRYYAITWSFFLIDGIIKVSHNSIALFELPSVGESLRGMLAMSEEAASQDVTGFAALLTYTIVHVIVVLCLQDQSFLPFSSMDVFSEGIELFNTEYPILLTAFCFSSDEELKGYANPMRPQFFPEWYTYRMYVMSSVEGFNTGRALLECLKPHKVIVFGHKGDCGPGATGQTSLLQVSDKDEDFVSVHIEGSDASLTMVANVEISPELQLACQQTIQFLRGHPAEDAHKAEVIEQALDCQARVRQALNNCPHTKADEKIPSDSLSGA